MKSYLVFVLLCICYPQSLIYAQTIATTDDGKIVLAHNDGTWLMKPYKLLVSDYILVYATDKDAKAFNKLVLHCYRESESFKLLIQHVATELAPDKALKLYVANNIPGVLNGQFRQQRIKGAKPHEIDMADIMKYPQPKPMPDGSFKFPSGIKNWSITRCQVLGHELAEALYAMTGRNLETLTGQQAFRQCHKYAIEEWENKIRKDYGQKSMRLEKGDAQLIGQTKQMAIVVFGDYIQIIDHIQGDIKGFRFIE